MGSAHRRLLVLTLELGRTLFLAYAPCTNGRDLGRCPELAGRRGNFCKGVLRTRLARGDQLDGDRGHHGPESGVSVCREAEEVPERGGGGGLLCSRCPRSCASCSCRRYRSGSSAE